MKVYTFIFLFTTGFWFQNQNHGIPITIGLSQKHQYTAWTDLLQKHVSNDGQVNYEGFRKDWADLKDFIKTLSTETPNTNWSKAETLSYWINAYNALTIDLILRHYPLKSIKDIKNPWKQNLWTLGYKTYNLDTIEHDILRKLEEPRIHFAIVCASYSCPKLQNSAFTAQNLDNQLNQATKDFMTDPQRNDISENKIKLSKIFQWFREDFEQNQTLIEFLNRYTNIVISKKARIRYQSYNWELND